MQTAASSANDHNGYGLNANSLQPPEPAHPRGDAIISVERGGYLATESKTYEPVSNKTGSLHECRILAKSTKTVAWGCKMNLLEIFQSDEAKIKDDRFKKFISQKR
jgi:hypothetical protein